MDNKNITVDKIVNICESIVISRGTEPTIKKFCCDTRLIKENDMFVSLKSEGNNNIQYVKEAFEKGAIGCITENDIPSEILEKNREKTVIKVKDVVKAIQEIAIYKRSLFNIPVIAITGSVGKTSTKDMIASVLKEKYNVSKTQGNYNNHIGVPLTILNWEENTEAAVVEMGMNHLGEIEKLTEIAKPTIAVITNIGTAHIGNLGTRENILKAKLEILKGLNESGRIVINNDNDLLHNCDTRKYKKITYGINNESNYVAQDIIMNQSNSEYIIKIDENKYKIKVPVSGEHFIYNSLCAISIGRELGIEIEKIINGINGFELTGNRNEIKQINDLIIINDFYNASYDSMKASLEVLARMSAKRKVAILGDMLELGEYSENLHRKVGEEVVKNKVDILLTIGENSRAIADEAKKQGMKEVYEFNTKEECINKIYEIIKKEDCVLLKASNGMKFGEISNYLQGDKLWKN